MPPCFPRPQQPSGRAKESLAPRLGPVALGGPFQHGDNIWIAYDNIWKQRWMTKTPDNLKHG